MLTIPARADSRTALYNALVQWVRDVIAGARDGLAMQDRYEVLSRLSGRELARHGLTRADFPRLAVNGEYGTIAAGRILFDKDAGSNRAPVSGNVALFFATILNSHGHTENSIVGSYEGRGWGDSTERELNYELANHRCSRF